MFFIVSPWRMIVRGAVLMFLALVFAGIGQDLIHQRSIYAIPSCLVAVAFVWLGFLSARNGIYLMGKWWRVNFGSEK